MSAEAQVCTKHNIPTDLEPCGYCVAEFKAEHKKLKEFGTKGVPESKPIDPMRPMRNTSRDPYGASTMKSLGENTHLNKAIRSEPMGDAGEKQFYYAFKHNAHCVMDRDAGVDWDCIQMRRSPGDGAERWIRRAVDALNSHDASKVAEKKAFWAAYEIAVMNANCTNIQKHWVEYQALLKSYRDYGSRPGGSVVKALDKQ